MNKCTCIPVMWVKHAVHAKSCPKSTPTPPLDELAEALSQIGMDTKVEGVKLFDIETLAEFITQREAAQLGFSIDQPNQEKE